MNEEYLQLKKRIEQELTNEYRVKLIIDTVIKYYGISRIRVFGKYNLAPIVLVRHMIIYVCCSVYGIPRRLISKNLKYAKSNIRNANDTIKTKLKYNSRIHSDLENIRTELTKILNANNT